jgi:hypothetical protein
MAEDDKKNGKPDGFLGSFLRPLKKHRVTLTKAGKSLAPFRKGKSKPKKGKKAPAKGKAKSEKKPLVLLSRRERQINELKTLASIGKRDPERLAAIITRMLMDEDEQADRERLKYERMLWKRAEKHGQPPPEDSDKSE